MNHDPRNTAGPARSGFTTSGYFTPTLVALLCLILLIASYERGHGHFHQITDAVSAPPPPPVGPTAPGGQDAIRLSRTATAIGAQPEFLSVTLLPGRGMEVLQITASIPGRGEVPLLFAPTLPEALDEWVDTGADNHGALGASSAAAFLLPWAGHLYGSPGGQNGSQPASLRVPFAGQTLLVPAKAEGGSESTSGLLLDRQSEGIQTSVLPDGQALQAITHAGSFGGSWPSSTDVTYRVELTGATVTLTLTATNTGSKPAPMGIGWKPHFAIPGGDRAAALLTVPSTVVTEPDPRSGLPTGRTVSASEAGLDFTRARGTALGSRELDATWTSLLSASSADGPIIELRDPGYGYALRLIPLSPSIQRVHVEAPPGKDWIVLQPETNSDDPTGQEWQDPGGGGLVLLNPGQSLTWKVRLEIGSIANETSPLPNTGLTGSRPASGSTGSALP